MGEQSREGYVKTLAVGVESMPMFLEYKKEPFLCSEKRERREGMSVIWKTFP